MKQPTIPLNLHDRFRSIYHRIESLEFLSMRLEKHLRLLTAAEERSLTQSFDRLSSALNRIVILGTRISSSVGERAAARKSETQ